MAELADAAVEAIGQCAARVPSVADACLSGLVSLIASSNENIVSAAVVVLKRFYEFLLHYITGVLEGPRQCTMHTVLYIPKYSLECFGI